MLFRKFTATQVHPRAILTIIIWLILAWVLSRPLKGIGESIYYFAGSVSNIAFQNISHSKSIAEELITSKKVAKEQSKTISLLEIKLNYLENQIGEVEKLKDLLNLKKRVSYKTISAKIIGRSPDNWHKQIILDKGINSEIKQGDSVISPKGVIGQVTEVEKDTSLVQLISDPSYKLGCKIHKKNILGILSGKTNTIGLLEFIPVGSDVMIGDIVETSGIATGGLLPTYPVGHSIGIVKKISKKKSKASDLYIEVNLSENLNTITEVLVFSPT